MMISSFSPASRAATYSRGSVGKVPLAHQVVGLDDLVNPLAPDTNSDTHDHVLRTFGNLAVNPQKVRSLKGLETELSSVICQQVRKSAFGH